MDLLSLQSHLSLRSSTSAYPTRKPGIAVTESVKLHKGPSKSKYLPQRYNMATSIREGSNGIEEGNGVIIVNHGSRRNESNLMLNEFVAIFRERTKYPIVEPTHMDIPSLTAEAAKEHPGVSYLITTPLGLHELLIDVVNDRINHCLSHIAGKADECSVCAGIGNCQLRQ